MALGGPLAWTLASCGSGAVGVETCRAIETRRCGLMTSCQADFDVDSCQRYYRDACLRGIAGSFGEGVDEATPEVLNACLGALDAVAACAASGVPTMGECTGVALTSSFYATDPPCSVLQSYPEHLAACAFVVEEVDAGSSDAAAQDAATDGG